MSRVIIGTTNSMKADLEAGGKLSEDEVRTSSKTAGEGTSKLTGGLEKADGFREIQTRS
jgi:hypothetical protein